MLTGEASRGRYLRSLERAKKLCGGVYEQLENKIGSYVGRQQGKKRVHLKSRDQNCLLSQQLSSVRIRVWEMVQGYFKECAEVGSSAGINCSHAM